MQQGDTFPLGHGRDQEVRKADCPDLPAAPQRGLDIVPVLVTGNETNKERVFGSANDTPYVKDGIDRAVVHGDAAAVDPGGSGTKAAMHHVVMVQAGGSARLRMRLTDTERVKPGGTSTAANPFAGFDELMRTRRSEAGEFWPEVLAAGDLTGDERLLIRQALAGMLWSTQYYALDVERWLAEHGADPLAGSAWLRNHDWRHLIAEDIISMPDTWEYPWFAAWDLAFHAVALAVADVGFAKQQLRLLLTRRYLHPNSQLPVYEWNFSLWDEQDGFFYDVLRRPDGSSIPLKVRSVVGLMPLAAATVVDTSVRTEFPQLVQGAAEFLARHPAVTAALWGHERQAQTTGPVLFALFDETRLRRILARMLDEDEFLGPHGIRSVSRWHAAHPYVITAGGQEYRVGYRPAESDTGMFGGNSNWRAGVIPDQRDAHPGAAEPPRLLRRTIQGRVPDRLRPAAEPA